MPKPKGIFVIRSKDHLPAAQAQELRKQWDAVAERMEDGGAVIVEGNISIYWLLPGQSTEEMDARAAKLRAEAQRIHEDAIKVALS